MSRAVKHIASPVATPGSKFCYYCILPGAWQPALNLVQGRTLQGPGRQLTQKHKSATQQKFNRCIKPGSRKIIPLQILMSALHCHYAQQ